ncbi:MAG TPA: hypothetical protein VJ249_05390 [Candidatus Bathyarchaeia archaeon]|nr:hypothetical protein [Candidatus Bathyarchaeia archaeon]
MSKDPQLLNCPHCNAPIDYVVGETLFTCKYCGYAFSWIKEGEFREIAPGKHFMLINNYSQNQMRDLVLDWMRKGFFKAGDLAEKSEMTETTLKFVPFWLVNVRADTVYRGKRRIETSETRTRSGPRGTQVSETVRRVHWVDKSGDFSDVEDWKVLAVKGMVFPVDKVELQVAGKMPFEIKNVSPGARLINGDVDEELAKREAEAGIRNMHARRARSEVDELLSINTNVQIGEAHLLTVPLWFVQYRYKGKPYPIIAEGANGRIIEGKAPVGKYDILAVVAVVIAIIAILFFILLFFAR